MGFEHDKRVILYPNYINAGKTVAEGRRIPKEKACENPNAVEMLDCCTKGLKLVAQLEVYKFYSRDWLVQGRIRVELKDATGKPLNPDIPTRKALMFRIAELVPKHPGRSKSAQLQRQQLEKEAAQAATAASSSSGIKGKGKDKKKGKR